MRDSVNPGFVILDKLFDFSVPILFYSGGNSNIYINKSVVRTV